MGAFRGRASKSPFVPLKREMCPLSKKCALPLSKKCALQDRIVPQKKLTPPKMLVKYIFGFVPP